MAELGFRRYFRDSTVLFIREMSVAKYHEMKYQYHLGKSQQWRRVLGCEISMHSLIRRHFAFVIHSGLSRLFSAMVVEGSVEAPCVQQQQHSWCCLRGALCMVWVGHCWALTSALDKYVKFLSTFDFVTSICFLKVITLCSVEIKIYMRESVGNVRP